MTAVNSEFLQGAADVKAFLDALQRYQGALHAHSARWVSRQARAAARYGRMLARHFRRAAVILRNKRRLLASSPLAKRRVSRRTLQRRLNIARARGLPRDVRRVLVQAGLGSAATRKARLLLPAKRPRTPAPCWARSSRPPSPHTSTSSLRPSSSTSPASRSAPAPKSERCQRIVDVAATSHWSTVAALRLSDLCSGPASALESQTARPPSLSH
jgi:hypothetical protein